MSNRNFNVMQQPMIFRALRLTIFFVAAGLTSASVSKLATLSVEKIDMSNNGTLLYDTLSFPEKLSLFKQFESNCKREYLSTADEQRRFLIFQQSLSSIDKLNARERAANGSVVFGVTIFSDLLEEEFQATYLGTKMPADFISTRKLMPIAPTVVRSTSVTSVDWRGIYTTPVKNQGGCGSCWAFSAVAQIESDAILVGLLTPESILSTQQVTKCTYTYDGCNGGFPTTAYDYVARVGGITTEAKYPYDISTSVCDRSKNDFAVTVVMSYRVIGEEAMISQVLAGRTLSVAVDANFWGPYQSGIFSGCSVDFNVNHAVNIVGVNVNEGYWIVRNSWGDWWGDNGYMKLAMGSNMCGVNNWATYTDAATVGSKYIPPTQVPTRRPNAQSARPSTRPIAPPTPAPSARPITPPTPAPSARPITPPTPLPSARPITPPTPLPSAQPVTPRTPAPSAQPVTPPTPAPSAQPVTPRTPLPSAQPVTPPTPAPSARPVTPPAPVPSAQPVTPPTPAPSARPITPPTPAPSARPSTTPALPSALPSTAPSAAPSSAPSVKPIAPPSNAPISSPSLRPSRKTVKPTRNFAYLTRRPTRSKSPSRLPTNQRV